MVIAIRYNTVKWTMFIVIFLKKFTVPKISLKYFEYISNIEALTSLNLDSECNWDAVKKVKLFTSYVYRRSLFTLPYPMRLNFFSVVLFFIFFFLRTFNDYLWTGLQSKWFYRKSVDLSFLQKIIIEHMNWMPRTVAPKPVESPYCLYTVVLWLFFYLFIIWL